ncbi:cupin [Orrella daihaiensis]|uniref:Cupin n=2 Tax=Orrella daihaiensis TaxID=2782176 RepID=A0ABY4AN07_9BURK|nr:cupin [Orrella daihaiensis]
MTPRDAVSGNLLSDLPSSPEAAEVFHALLSFGNVRIERIVSTGQVSPEGFWYDQTQAEWILLVQGSATLRFEDELYGRNLAVGDFLYIAPHRRHRVQFTQASPPTVWLAIHIESNEK